MQQNNQNLSGDKYDIREAEIHEQPLIVSFLNQHFFPHEPLLSMYLKSAKCSDTEMLRIKDELQRIHEFMIAKLPCCLVAVHRDTQKIVGMCLLSIEIRKSNLNNGACDLGDSFKSRLKILSDWFKCVLDVADEKIDFFDKFPGIEKILKVLIVTVDRNHGKKGLATNLLKEALNFARSRGIQVVGGTFTSPYSRRAAEKVGFQTYADIDSRSFRDANGKSIYTEPHVTSIMAIQLS
ncbi:hypothetical protein QAD02_009214 [Eretmocerus hayati]|uniref:Uncharacterized protein n=1 Tax=Eretmocerus hayati TaxID=131215 RepID=A0ACC2N915_9HYME|nr:hypothetical protein QAD02_009214 [Eretmocerus hayati]